MNASSELQWWIQDPIEGRAQPGTISPPAGFHNMNSRSWRSAPTKLPPLSEITSIGSPCRLIIRDSALRKDMAYNA